MHGRESFVITCKKKKEVQEGLQAIPLCHVSPFLHVAKAGPT